MKHPEKAAQAVALLREKQQQLRAEGQDRLPKRSDFQPEEVMLIKAHLGPFPRALETAGLKAPREDGHAERRLQKRIAAKRRKIAAKRLAHSKTDDQGEDQS